MEQTQFYGTGRRKTYVARVWLKPGEGKITVNSLEITRYLPRKTLQMIVRQPFDATNTLGRYDVVATVKGGGQSGQAGALKHGIARALLSSDETHKDSLRRGGFLTRDTRRPKIRGGPGGTRSTPMARPWMGLLAPGLAARVEQRVQLAAREHGLLHADLADGATRLVGFVRDAGGGVVADAGRQGGDHGQTAFDQRSRSFGRPRARPGATSTPGERSSGSRARGRR